MEAKHSSNADMGETPHLQDLISGLRLFPGDDCAGMKTMRSRLLEELDPQTAYEEVVAGNLVGLELERRRLQQIRDRILLEEIHAEVKKVIDQKVYSQHAAQIADAPDFLEKIREKTMDLEQRLLSTDIQEQKPLLSFLEEEGISAESLQAIAYSQARERLLPFEAQLVAIEQRRRRLFDDYERLRAQRPKLLEDFDLDGDL